MVTSEPARTSHVQHNPPHEGVPSPAPALKPWVRGLNLVGGLITSVIALLVVGLLAGLAGCFGVETHGLCDGNAWLVPVLEWAIFAVAVIAPAAGGIAAFVAQRPRWLALGVALALAMFLLLLAVANGQTSALS